jgi:sigma-B regulation protein RsbU (phosphoserine phosphatase)
LSHAVETLNSELLRESDDSMGVTMLVVLVDCARGELVMVNAGHENPVLLRADGAVDVVPMDGGPPFCVMDFPYPEERLTLAPGETLVLITDGVSEAQDEHGTLFGIEGALDWLKQADQSDPAALVSGLMRAVRAFEEPAEPADDLTVMAIRYNGPKAA